MRLREMFGWRGRTRMNARIYRRMLAKDPLVAALRAVTGADLGPSTTAPSQPPTTGAERPAAVQPKRTAPGPRLDPADHKVGTAAITAYAKIGRVPHLIPVWQYWPPGKGTQAALHEMVVWVDQHGCCPWADVHQYRTDEYWAMVGQIPTCPHYPPTPAEMWPHP